MPGQDTDRLLGAFQEGIGNLKVLCEQVLEKQDILKNEFVEHKLEVALMRQSIQNHLMDDASKFKEIDLHIENTDKNVDSLQLDKTLRADRMKWAKYIITGLLGLEGDSLTGAHLHKWIGKLFGA